MFIYIVSVSSQTSDAARFVIFKSCNIPIPKFSANSWISDCLSCVYVNNVNLHAAIRQHQHSVIAIGPCRSGTATQCLCLTFNKYHDDVIQSACPVWRAAPLPGWTDWTDMVTTHYRHHQQSSTTASLSKQINTGNSHKTNKQRDERRKTYCMLPQKMK